MRSEWWEGRGSGKQWLRQRGHGEAVRLDVSPVFTGATSRPCCLHFRLRTAWRIWQTRRAAVAAARVERPRDHSVWLDEKAHIHTQTDRQTHTHTHSLSLSLSRSLCLSLSHVLDCNGKSQSRDWFCMVWVHSDVYSIGGSLRGTIRPLRHLFMTP